MGQEPPGSWEEGQREEAHPLWDMLSWGDGDHGKVTSQPLLCEALGQVVLRPRTLDAGQEQDTRQTQQVLPWWHLSSVGPGVPAVPSSPPHHSPAAAAPSALQGSQQRAVRQTNCSVSSSKHSPAGWAAVGRLLGSWLWPPLSSWSCPRPVACRHLVPVRGSESP